jgi:Zn finger protein HypA/HybF involved in hydrogenase expression
LVLTIFVIPLAVVALVGMMAFRRVTPLVYHCRRCQRDFQRAAHRAFPTACPRCRARDWNA